jgi:hypothetical protein
MKKFIPVFFLTIHGCDVQKDEQTLADDLAGASDTGENGFSSCIERMIKFMNLLS